MQLNDAIILSRYIKVLEYNRISQSRINELRKEYTAYVAGEIQKTELSEELTQFLNYLDLEEQERKSNERRI